MHRSIFIYIQITRSRKYVDLNTERKHLLKAHMYSDTGPSYELPQLVVLMPNNNKTSKTLPFVWLIHGPWATKPQCLWGFPSGHTQTRLVCAFVVRKTPKTDFLTLSEDHMHNQLQALVSKKSVLSDPKPFQTIASHIECGPV